MDRRDLFTISRPQARQGQDFGSIPVSSTGLTPYSGSWTISEVKHLLKRTMFGSPKADINYFLSMGMNDSVDTLLELINHPAYTQPLPPLNNYNNLVVDPECLAGDPWPGTPDTNNGTVYTYTSRMKSLKSWWISQMLNQPRSLREKMVLFWCNHFVVEFDTVQVGTYIYKYNQLIRDNALGNFKTLTREMTINSAMLRYLNGDKNSASAPNENYGRELQELFTVGKDTNGNPQYTEDDVKEAAKVLSGWRNDVNSSGISANGFNSYFLPNKHDITNKVFSSWYNGTTIQGQTGTNGANEIDDLLNMIFLRSEVAENICRKLYRWFLYYEIDANAETNVILPLATILRNNNYDIVPVLSTLFKSEHFFDVMSRGCMIKSPIDFSVGMCREFNLVFPDNTDITAQYAAWDRIRQTGSNLQFNIGDPPNVAGLTAYYQEPSYHELWINSDTLPKRNQFTDRMMSNGYTNYGQTIEIDSVAFTMNMSNPSDPVLLIGEVLSSFFAIDSTSGIEAFLLSILLSGQSTNNYWSDAWDDYFNDQTNTMYYNIVKTRLDSFYKYIMDLSEYQLS
jgi:uncharacterized protein (DUF1800 family)